mmetsp:Transcript_28443/g.77043  ORF Transcript_28443/g.77043 Transcript_28443/m.77043 type:complete len:608 (+) Transcript_28443:312-2135(+)
MMMVCRSYSASRLKPGFSNPTISITWLLREDLNRSITPPERWQILQKALHLFSHDNVEFHDYEISLGLDKALCLKLGYVVVTSNSNHVSQEILLICKCLLQIFKCSSTKRLRSFRHVGVTELLPILIQLWTGIIECKIDTQNHSPQHDEGLVSIIRVVRLFSKLIPAKSFLINYLQGAYLGHSLREMLIWIDEPASSILYSSGGVLWETIGLLKDLTFRSQTADKQILLRLNDGVLFRILSICFQRITTLHPRIQEWCTAVIWNLVLDPVICQDIMSGNDANENDGNTILEGLLEALIQNPTTNSQSDFALKVKRNATSAIGNIVSDAQNHNLLFRRISPGVSHELIPRLMDLVLKDSDSVIRRRAMRTIRCLAGSMDEGARALVQQRNLSLFLVGIASEQTSENNKDNEDTQIQVCQTIIALKSTINSENSFRLQKCLVDRIETATSTKIVSAASLCLSECLDLTPFRQSVHNFTDSFWTCIERSTTASSECHSSVSKLLLAVATMERESENGAPQEMKHARSILTKTSIINTLTTILLEPESTKEGSGNEALHVVQILAGREINKRPLAENDRLLSGLVTLCLTQPDPQIKDSAKSVIMLLVPEI